ncbi:MAG: Peptidase, family, partial [Armatimonadetes bacterium]|nr:Peptidase, family [Armatimonadota bacterium]
MRLYFLRLLTLTILMGGSVPSTALASSLEVRPSAPRQGEAIFVRLEGEGIESPRATWRGKEYPLYEQQSGWAAVLPISPETPSGGQRLRVRYSSHGAPQEETRVVQVARVTFPVQRLRMSGAKSSLYTYPGVKQEDAIIGGAARTVSSVRSWSGDWTLPAKGRLSTPFGVRRLRNGKAVGRHRGLDIAAPEGTPVLAPAGGRVVLAGKYRKHGNTVV